MGQSRPINSEWKTGCITKSNRTEELNCCEPAKTKRRAGTLQTISIYKAKNLMSAGDARKKNNIWILTTSTLANWMVKVGTTSKRDVKQKEKKP